MQRSILRFSLFLFSLLTFAATALADDPQWFERKAEWRGFDQYHFKVVDRGAYIVAPKQSAEGNPWIWRARFPDYHAEMDVMMLEKGYHVAYVDVAGLLGCPKAVEIGDAFYDYVTKERGLAARPILEGVSRGGLFVYNWTAKNPDKVACIYCDTPVLDFKSWPGGLGTGQGAKGTWQECLKVYGLTEEEAKAYDKNPIDHAKILADAKIPILHIVSENDTVVPPKENTYILQDRLKEQGHSLEVISVAEGTAQSHGHHFDHPEPERVVEFMLKHTAPAE